MCNDQQVFTVFGGSYVAENHSYEPANRKRRSVGPLGPVIVALMVGTVTTAGAIAGTQRIHATGYGFSHSNIPAVAHFEVARY
jgi:hypothetical protein